VLRMRPHAGGDRRGLGARLLLALAVVVVGALVVLALDGRFFDLPDWLDGGRSDPAPRGSLTYKGQEARAASERFLIDIGDGEAIVELKAKQNWDRRGWLVNGDFQSTNGTSSVSDPEDGDLPARLRVAVDYCADGTLTTTTADDDGRTLAVAFEMGTLYVCDTTLEHTTANDAAFRQDDTPADFHGRFVSFVSRAAEATAAASACPREELAEFRSADYRAFVAEQLAERHGLAVGDVEVTVGDIGRSDDETRGRLQEALDRVTSLQDPDDPDVRYEALSVQYLAGDGEAVEDACYLDPGSRDLDSLRTPPSE
jgi:hypothetical protein